MNSRLAPKGFKVLENVWFYQTPRPRGPNTILENMVFIRFSAPRGPKVLKNIGFDLIPGP